MRSEKSTSARDNRRTNKPMMEKRRRARINASLSELKSLLLDAVNKESGRHNKMEKADILEMTVKHMREVQHSNTPHSLTDLASEDLPSNSSTKHRRGYNECKQEVSKYLDTVAGCDVELKARVLDHLASKTMTSPPNEPMPFVTGGREIASPVISHDQKLPSNTELPKNAVAIDINNNVSSVTSLAPTETTKVFSAMQVIPTKLSTGEVAFVVPTNIVNNGQVSNYAVPVSLQNTPSLSFTNQVLSGSPVTSVAATQILTLPQSSTVYPMTQVSGNIAIIPCSGITETCLLPPATEHSKLPLQHVQHAPHASHAQAHAPNLNDNRGSHFESRDHLEGRKGSVWRPWSQI
ncbi:transcription factor HES-1-B-like isoform X1 [Haliotis rufescens]|uniref:transcription factor HES-1-B-like isoform X1 n=1 Tax=Haliotis rufescens TaxID=6454 RepID=UPI00201F733F|nr:transcription factor HES-1-B-like isoform X1 [Haliotis rufescens]